MIGSRIRQLRLERNMTLQVLADACGITKGHVSRIENCPTSPPVSTLIKIGMAQGVIYSPDTSDAGDQSPG